MPWARFCGALAIGAVVATSAQADTVVAIAKARINLRSAPDLQASILEVLPRGTRVQILERHGEFARVKRLPDEKTGYLAHRYLLIPEGATPEATVVPTSAPEQSVDDAAGPEVTSEAFELVAVEALQTEPEGGAMDASQELASAEAPSPAEKGTSALDSAPAWSGLSVVLGAGIASSDISAVELSRQLAPHASDVNVRKLDESAASWTVRVGYALTPTWSIEASFVDLGEYNSAVETRNADADAIEAVLAAEHPVGGSGLGLQATGHLRRGPWDFSASAGLLKALDADIELSIDGQKLTVEGESLSPYMGLSADFRLAQHWSLGLNASYLELNQRLLQAQLQLGFEF